jgi:hypothetical protein
MTQRVLKPWWQWTYQNSAVKRAAARAIPGWVTSWEVWYGEPKADNIVSLGVGRYKWYQSHCPAWDGGSVHKPIRVADGHLLGCQEWGDPMRVASEDAGSKGGWLWRLTSPGNEDVLICINAPFMTQRVLKPWWQWTYQNSTVKRAAARAIPGWVTSWEVWYGEPKADNIVSLGVGRYIKIKLQWKDILHYQRYEMIGVS